MRVVLLSTAHCDIDTTSECVCMLIDPKRTHMYLQHNSFQREDTLFNIPTVSSHDDFMSLAELEDQ